MICSTCNGSGRHPLMRTKFCSDCGGSGDTKYVEAEEVRERPMDNNKNRYEAYKLLFEPKGGWENEDAAYKSFDSFERSVGAKSTPPEHDYEISALLQVRANSPKEAYQKLERIVRTMMTRVDGPRLEGWASGDIWLEDGESLDAQTIADAVLEGR